MVDIDDEENPTKGIFNGLIIMFLFWIIVGLSLFIWYFFIR